MIKIKLLALANGDTYQDCRVENTIDDFLDSIKKSEFIKVCCEKREVLINSEYIISMEL